MSISDLLKASFTQNLLKNDLVDGVDDVLDERGVRGSGGEGINVSLAFAALFVLIQKLGFDE